jgi:uncharacterized repeat protein (TIGR03943 family)
VTAPARRVAAPWWRPGAASLLALGYGAYLLQAWATGTLYFYVARFVVQCCAVDAQPIGLPVRAPEAGSLEAGAWVDVEGEIVVGEVAGRRRAVVAAVAVRPTSPPEQPYLY